VAGFAQEHTEHDGEDNTRDPEDAALAEVGDVILRAGKTLAEQIGENGSDQRGHSEGKEVNSPCPTQCRIGSSLWPQPCGL
jgi:hypothetical protein